MKFRSLLFCMVLSLLIMLLSPAAFGEVDYDNTYETALRLKGNDLTNLDTNIVAK